MTPAPSPATREDLAVTQMYIRHRANSALSQEPTPSEAELVKVRAAVLRASLRLVSGPTGPFDMACFGCDAGRHETRQFCASCDEVTDSYPRAGGVL